MIASLRATAMMATPPLATLAQQLMPHENERALQSILRPTIYRRFSRDAALTELETELSTHLDAPNPVASYFLANRTRRGAGLSPCCLYAQLGRVICPYLDTDLFNLLASLPASLFLDYAFHTEAIHRGHPRYAAIPFERKQVYAVQGKETYSQGFHGGRR